MPTTFYATDNTFMDAATPDTPENSSNWIELLEQSGTDKQGIIKWDLSSISGDIITAATFRFNLYDATKAGSPELRVGYVPDPGRSGWTRAACTWNKYDGVNAWSGGGSKVDTDPPTEMAWPSSDGWKTLDVSSLLIKEQAEVGDDEVHLLVYGNRESGEYMRGSIRGFGQSSFKPELIVTHYTPVAYTKDLTETVNITDPTASVIKTTGLAFVETVNINDPNATTTVVPPGNMKKMAKKNFSNPFLPTNKEDI